MSNPTMAAAAIAVAALVTALTRALPYLILGSRKTPKTLEYLGSVLPASIMTILAVFCLRNTRIATFPCGLPELAAVGLVILLQLWRKNPFLSIFWGTACYMTLLRVL